MKWCPVTQFTQWIEYLKFLGADGINLYVTSSSSRQLDQLLLGYEQDVFRLVTTSNWTTVHSVSETVVSAEAAVNQCVYDNMLKYRYILILSPLYFPMFTGGGYPSDLKQLVRDESFRDGVKEYGGYRLSAGDTVQPAMIVRSKSFLAAAANHFIALTDRSYFRQLSTVTIGTVTDVNRYNKRLMQELKKMADAKLKH